MTESVKALVKPALLTWARASARLGVEESARRAQVKEEQLRAWEEGDGQPSIPQLRKLGRVYKRPLAVFFLPTPPKVFDALRDFRRLPQDRLETQSPELAFEIRRAHARREIALDLHSDLYGEKPPLLALTARLDEEPEEVAARLRKRLGVTSGEVARWRTSYDALNGWRRALEAAGVLVFQAEDVEVTEMRGFSISEQSFPVVVVNIKDSIVGRVFSMLHEATHLMLREGGVCDLEEGSSSQGRVEVFCNHVAAATLMPGSLLLKDEPVLTHRGSDWTDDAIVWIAQRYRVSREAVVRRLLVLGKTTEAFYRKKRAEYRAEFEAQRDEAEQRKASGQEDRGFAPPDRMAVARAGHVFARLVLNSYHQDRITANDLSSFLEVRLKHLSKIERAVLGRPEQPSAKA